jgi:hypothetical protein
MDDTRTAYPLRVEGTLDPSLSRWLWLVKWLLAIPHFIVLAFLWAAFAVMSVIAFVAILFTGRYPRAIFEFNVGVLRWTWRVVFYAYGALGTDRYPPFALDEVADYPATLVVDYPERLSRGLVLVKWWLLAIPHYAVVAFFLGGGGWLFWHEEPGVWGVGLIVLLVLVAGVGLLFTGRYARGIFDLVLGLDRWVFRVAAYAGLMTDAYPPFRLDQGGVDRGPAAAAPVPSGVPAAAAPERGWTGGRIAAVVVGSVLALVSLGLLAGGCATVVVDQTQRDADGYLMTHGEQLDTGSYALVSETLNVSVDIPQWVIDELIGRVRVRSESDRTVFVGIAPKAEASAYLDGVRHAVVTDIKPDPEYSTKPGGAPSSPPGAQRFWVASSQGAGEQVVDWKVEDGKWVAVVMNVDGSPGVTTDLAIGAEVDALIWIGVGLLLGGMLFGLAAAGLIYWGIPKRRG